MSPKKAISVLMEAEKNPLLFATDEFIKARMKLPVLTNLFIEMGPNCNLKCFHCASDCGTDKKGLPNPEIVNKVLEQAKTSIRSVCLTDGEPLREENREVIEVVAKYSNNFFTNTVSNGTFAKTLNDTINWFSFLKNKGIDYSKKNSSLCISFGKPYNVPTQNYKNIAIAAKEVFPELDMATFLAYRFINFGDGKDTINRVNEIIKIIEDLHGKRRKEYISANQHRVNVHIYPKKGKTIKIGLMDCVPIGRAERLRTYSEIFDKWFPKKELSPDDLYMTYKDGEGIILLNNGDVSLCDGFGKFNRNFSYGNINSKPLEEITLDIVKDKFFQAYTLGGVPFIYYVAKQINPNFKMIGRTRYHVIREITSDENMISGIRRYLDKNFLGNYKKFASSIDTNPRRKC
ncbi:MAG: hypothetical protein WC755_04670 [Candidatus Woesearchaeota archaeon]